MEEVEDKVDSLAVRKQIVDWVFINRGWNKHECAIRFMRSRDVGKNLGNIHGHYIFRTRVLKFVWLYEYRVGRKATTVEGCVLNSSIYIE